MDASLAFVTEVALLEGPAADRDGSVVMSDVIGDRMLRYAPGSGIRVIRAPAGRANGNVYDGQGRLITCEGAEHGPGGGRRIVRQDQASGQLTVLADRYQGARLNSPNDVTVAQSGQIFTDPRYGDRSDMETDVEGVYRIDPDGNLTRLLGQPEVQRPNGIAISPDGRALYVIDSNYAVPDGNRRIWAFDLSAGGDVSRQRVVHDFGRGRGGDGMEVDQDGVLYVCAGITTPRSANETADVAAGVYRVRPNGDIVDLIPIPTDLITNCCFGGSDMRTLYVTAGHRLYRTRVEVPGWHVQRW